MVHSKLEDCKAVVELMKNENIMKRNKVPSVYLQKLHKTIKTEYIEELKAEGILVDYEVTRDPRRIIRLPGTIHHKGRPCKIISYEELDDFIPPEKIW